MSPLPGVGRHAVSSGDARFWGSTFPGVPKSYGDPKSSGVPKSSGDPKSPGVPKSSEDQKFYGVPKSSRVPRFWGSKVF